MWRVACGMRHALRYRRGKTSERCGDYFGGGLKGKVELGDGRLLDAHAPVGQGV